jgi:hypothetical protein
MLLGAILNYPFLREMLMFRGAARRTEETAIPPVARDEAERKLRIR